ncbi:hypothetical protein ACHAW5_008399 [Stephanodiscus triporus]|uniref:RBR-type E3 ubiquitin transferase n=1 Tax=Stephanodiscus triporus TaxID=2934178 RepID=A0ABD3QFB0_9STRA
MKSAASATSVEKYSALLSSASKTAGDDSWKTTVGRIDGPDGFVLGDAWRFLKVRFHGASKPPDACPVCLDKPTSEDEWYVTKSCKHPVCRGCLQDYAASLVSDPDHSGPLKCPCCPRLLRVEDAKVALDRRRVLRESPKSASDRRVATPEAVIQRASLFAKPGDVDFMDDSAVKFLEKWEDKSRDEILRSMEDFRPCPHCSSGGGSGRNAFCSGYAGSSNKGGGFVTPDCLAPINEERERTAERLLGMVGNPSSTGILVSYFVYYFYCTGRSTQFDRGEHYTEVLQVLSAVLPSVLLPILPHVIGLVLASAARRVVLRPICVTCPCCLVNFNLEASSELQLRDDDAVAESATQRWKASNTRPCPGCASPIIKDGGCNHVKCGRCRVEFCWACMRSRTRCLAYQCTNGAPFGNAFRDGTMFAMRAGHDVMERERQTGQTLIERIDQVEALALRNLSLLHQFPFASILIFASSVFYSWKILSLAMSLFSPCVLFFVILLYYASMSS